MISLMNKDNILQSIIIKRKIPPKENGDHNRTLVEVQYIDMIEINSNEKYITHKMKKRKIYYWTIE
uniref:Uncharacterized protein n=1 Tax=Moumouvirus sp. 'Monve' TaxID=1128131 RepID=H2EDD4_9VIRU|nr:hypothetical protein mv_L202 [Moumouvirus Monve]